MKRISVLLALFLILSLLNINAGFTQDNISLSISCTIPSIPGVNAPLIEEESVKTETDTPAPTTPQTQKEAPAESSQMVEQENQPQVQDNKGQKSIVVLRTIYSR
ncbi:MAG: hypothetical protein PVI33_04555 [Candidatus Omnitrophota bacterium]